MRNRNLLLGAVALAAVLSAACNSDGDKIAPEGSQIFVSANPATVVLVDPCQDKGVLLPGITTCGTSTIVATVTSSTGFPLEDQDVRFTTTAGVLFTGTLDNPTEITNLPVRTDGFGNAMVNLITFSTTTVEARSGLATGSLTLNTIQGNLSQITLNLDTVNCPGTNSDVTSCSQNICFVAEALDTSGQGIENLTIQFRLQDHQTTGSGTFDGTFAPQQALTDAFGQAFTTFTPNTACSNECASNECDGSAQVLAFTQGGFQSLPLLLTININ